MSLTLITGGAKSGKSSFAEELLEGKNISYIATNVPRFFDSEMEERVARHQKQRDKNWHTEERFLEIGSYLKENYARYDGFLLDCVTLLTTNLFFHYLKKEEQSIEFEELTTGRLNQLEEQIYEEWETILQVISEQEIPILMVTNEVGSGVVPERKMGRWFQDVLGRVNQKIGKKAEHVYFVVCGIPQKIK
ncbi:adenosylcobinamide kinase/adenosylcobinamide-phosphate guanylyltransferase [Enterococcus sp. AZ194]|uniref:bifunctional adenosylcobinamide kinase/adenosylcobinamide-phosphate guanylyltransferase n=1 Tax=Enterococcus sp. AZ194 TaxID=2774629 RepID=UPI003F281A42